MDGQCEDLNVVGAVRGMVSEHAVSWAETHGHTDAENPCSRPNTHRGDGEGGNEGGRGGTCLHKCVGSLVERRIENCGTVRAGGRVAQLACGTR